MKTDENLFEAYSRLIEKYQQDVDTEVTRMIGLLTEDFSGLSKRVQQQLSDERLLKLQRSTESLASELERIKSEMIHHRVVIEMNARVNDLASENHKRQQEIIQLQKQLNTQRKTLLNHGDLIRGKK